jgi:hypothetical protein
MSRTLKIYLTHSLANLQEPYRKNLHDLYRGQSTRTVPWKSSWPIPWPIYKSHTVKIFMAHSVANLNELHRENTHVLVRGQSKCAVPWKSKWPFLGQSTWAIPWKSTWPVPCPIYVGRTVKIYTTHSVFSRQEPYRENLYEPCHNQPTWCVPSPVYIFDAFTMEDKKCTQQLRQVSLTDFF